VYRIFIDEAYKDGTAIGFKHIDKCLELLYVYTISDTCRGFYGYASGI
jgi:hypothetical protein